MTKDDLETLETLQLMAAWMKEQMNTNELLRMRIEMLEAHSENLIERVYALEQP